MSILYWVWHDRYCQCSTEYEMIGICQYSTEYDMICICQCSTEYDMIGLCQYCTEYEMIGFCQYSTEYYVIGICQCYTEYYMICIIMSMVCWVWRDRYMSELYREKWSITINSVFQKKKNSKIITTNILIFMPTFVLYSTEKYITLIHWHMLNHFNQFIEVF
jgi:hypothetical protein